MKKYWCYFEDDSKNVNFELCPYDDNKAVELSITAYAGVYDVIEICLTEKQVDELIEELLEYKNNRNLDKI